MNVSVLFFASAALLFPPEEHSPPNKETQVVNSVILINGTPTVATITASADIVSIYGTDTNYFDTEEDDKAVIDRVINDSPMTYGLISDLSFVIRDTAEVDIFSEEQVDALREVAIDYENSLRQAQIILKYADESMDLSLAQSIRSVLIDFGIEQSDISMGRDTISNEDNYGVQVSLMTKSTARL